MKKTTDIPNSLLKLTSVKIQTIIDMSKPTKNLWCHVLRFGRLKKDERRFPINFSQRNPACKLHDEFAKLIGKSMTEVEQAGGKLYKKYKKFNYK